ncbi:MAG: dienelactone hydrolase family protein [Proteobacteria bacterium]|nr:dienelactone hydrolase family protein [Pseudomonadota bacterium]
MTTWIAGAHSGAPLVTGFEDFESGSFTSASFCRPVYRTGSGPAVIVIHEIPGIYDKVFEFARRVRDSGFTVYLPSLLGTPGRPLTLGYGIAAMAKLCVSKEFNRFAYRTEAPIADWLRALARDAHAQCGGPGVGAVGMCFSGGFALAMMADEHVIAPVLSQPSMPFTLNKRMRADIDTRSEDLPRIREHMERHDTCLLGLRFTGDRFVPRERFEYLKETFGERFEAVNIDSSPGNSHGIRAGAHSVLTNDFVDDPDHPTYQALTKVLGLFRRQLLNS